MHVDVDMFVIFITQYDPMFTGCLHMNTVRRAVSHKTEYTHMVLMILEACCMFVLWKSFSLV